MPASTRTSPPLPLSCDAAGPAPAGALTAALRGERIAGLDFLRAVSVLLVMWDHGLESFSGPVPGLVEAFGGLSALGVEIFFVISGFLITWLLLDELERHGRIDYLGFYRRRIARLMPVFYLYLAIGLLILVLRERPVPWAPVSAAVFYVVNYYQAFTGAATNLVAHCWSLAVEEQFYFVWPLLAGALYARRRQGMAAALVWLILAVWVWRWTLLAMGVSVDYLYRALDTRADHLLAGCLLARLLRDPVTGERLRALCARGWLIVPLAAALCASTAFATTSSTYKYAIGFVVEPLLIGLLIVAVVLAAQPGRTAARWFNHALPVEIGRVSYGMYLFHGMIMYTVQRQVEARTGSAGLGLLLACIVVLAFASLCFRVFEQPMRRRIAGRAAHRR